MFPEFLGAFRVMAPHVPFTNGTTVVFTFHILSSSYFRTGISQASRISSFGLFASNVIARSSVFVAYLSLVCLLGLA